MNFTESVWELTKQVPKGRVTTYKSIAEALGTRAYRAVGMALNRNRCSAVPCHRVVGSDGCLVGFAFGLKEKRRLLESEGLRVEKGKIVGFRCILFDFSAETWR